MKIQLTISMSLEVIRYAYQESLNPKMSTEHPDDRAALQVANSIEYLIDFKSILDGHLDWVRAAQRIQLKSCLYGFSLYLCHHIVSSTCSRNNTSGHASYNKLAPDVPF